MKSNGAIRALCAGLLLAAGGYGAASAAVIADQTLLTSVGLGDFAGSTINLAVMRTQSFTAGQAGLLSMVDMQVWGTSGTFRFSLYDGDLAAGSGSFIGSIDRDYSTLPLYGSNQVTHFDVSSFGYQVTPGKVFTVLSSAVGAGARFAQAIGYFDPLNLDVDGFPTLVPNAPYLGGSASIYLANAGNGSPGWSLLGGDRGFQTFVDVVTTPSAPLLPTASGQADKFDFAFTAAPGEVVFVDPLMTTGYDYEVFGSSPNIASALFPVLAGDTDGYQLFGLDGALLGTAIAGVTYDFGAGGVCGFRLRDIDVRRLVGDQTAFVTGLSFVDGGDVQLTQTANPVSFVPEPASWAMMIAGFGMVGAAARSRRRVAVAA